ncbi:MAG: hypothetical protein IMY73_02510 [Bacteroidetes bacterium]|nr:hypothetical protein [Bacteroidota bacterium]
MKKLLTLMAIFTVALTSCSSDDEFETSTLDGTTWCVEYDESQKINDMKMEVKVYIGYDFTKSNVESKIGAAVMIDGKAGKYEYDIKDGKYSYNPPKIKMTIDNETIVGTISGNKMTLTDEGEILVLTKK